MLIYHGSIFGFVGQDSGFCASPCLYTPLRVLLNFTSNVSICEQIDKLNLEGYANLENWVAELDKRIENIFLQRLTSIIQVWCTEFDRSDEGELRKDTLPVSNLRDAAGKRRGVKGVKEEKVCCFVIILNFTTDVCALVVYGNTYDRQADCT